MNRNSELGLSELARRVLDGDEIDWDHELRRSPEDAEAIRALRDVERLALAHRLATLVTTTGGASGAGEGSPLAAWGPLRILEKIGEGSSGEVFRAYDPRLQIEVALKLFRPARTGTFDSLLAEARSLARVHHPNVLQVHGADEHDGRMGMWSELLRGQTLEELLAHQGALGPREATVIGIDLCRALAAVHAAGLVHGDVKTANVMRAAGGRIILMDFGTAALPEDMDPAFGTPITMAPEQLLGEPGTRSTDLYALGVLLYRLVTGRYPIEAGSVEALRAAHRANAAVPLRDRRPDLPATFVQNVERATAPRPGHRHSSAGEMERALLASLAHSGWTPAQDAAQRAPAPGGATQPVPSVARGPWFVRRRWIAAAALTVGLVGLAAVMFNRRPTPAALPGTKKWILVADFDGPPDDSSLTVATRELVCAALDQSRSLASVPPEQIRLALAMAGKPAGTPVTPELARELAYRSAVGSVVEGRVSRIGRGYSVVVRLMDAEGHRLILTESAMAKNEDALIPALGRLVDRLRAGLGENPGVIRSGVPVEAAATPSFEAYRLYVRAFNMELSFMHREAIPVLHNSLALDPEFAMAWSELAYVFFNSGFTDSAQAAIREALRHPSRLTQVQRLTLEGDRMVIEGNLQGAIGAYDRALEEDPMFMIALVNSSVALFRLGRFEESLQRVRLSERAGPYGASDLQRWDEVRDLISLGRVDEARNAARLTPGLTGDQLRIAVELLAERWSAAESVAVALASDPRANHRQRAAGLLCLASAQAARGAVRAAAETYDRGDPFIRVEEARFDRLMLSVVTEGALPLPAGDGARDGSTDMLVARGLQAALGGDWRTSERLLRAARADADTAPVALIEAQTEALAGRWDEVVRILRPIASSPNEIMVVGYPPSLSAARWFLADAFGKLGQRDSAAAWLESLTSDPVPVFQELSVRGIFSPFAHRRLALLYARMGRLEEARQHWQKFADAVRTPDPELGPLIEEARSALATAKTDANPVGSFGFSPDR